MASKRASLLFGTVFATLILLLAPAHAGALSAFFEWLASSASKDAAREIRPPPSSFERVAPTLKPSIETLGVTPKQEATRSEESVFHQMGVEALKKSGEEGAKEIVRHNRSDDQNNNKIK